MSLLPLADPPQQYDPKWMYLLWKRILAIMPSTGVLPATSGGTGQSSYAVGDILYADTTTSLSKLADVATGNAIISGGVSTAPSWGKIDLTTHVSGELPGANLANAGVIAKVLTGYTSGAGTVAATDSILQAIQKLDGNIGSVSSSSSSLRIIDWQDGEEGGMGPPGPAGAKGADGQRGIPGQDGEDGESPFPAGRTSDPIYFQQVSTLGGFNAQTIPAGVTLEVPVGYSMVIAGNYTVTGDLLVSGDMLVI